MPIMCTIRGHQPDRGLARHDGADYWTQCKRCDVTLIRDHDGWRRPTEAEEQAHQDHVAAKQGLHNDAGLPRK